MKHLYGDGNFSSEFILDEPGNCAESCGVDNYSDFVAVSHNYVGASLVVLRLYGSCSFEPVVYHIMMARPRILVPFTTLATDADSYLHILRVDDFYSVEADSLLGECNFA